MTVPMELTAARLVSPRRHTRIAAAPRWPSLGLAELYRHRGLLWFLAWRNVKVRYTQTVLGAAWAMIQPVFTMVVFTMVFGRFARIPSDGAPYAVFSLAALVPWTYFSSALSGASGSLVSSTNLITKVYFPRLVIPTAAIAAGLVDFAIAFGVLIVVLLANGIMPSPLALLVVPILLVIMLATAAGVGCWLGALHVRYRDIRYITAFLLHIWMYVSPVVYPSSVVPAQYRWLLNVNPMTAVIEGFRAVLIGTTEVPWVGIACAAATSGVMLVAGVMFFRRAERAFADVV